MIGLGLLALASGHATAATFFWVPGGASCSTTDLTTVTGGTGNWLTGTYTGATTVTGTLEVGNGAIAGAISGTSGVTLASSSTLRFNRSDSFTFDKVITGSGKLEKNGAGTLTLTGTQNYTGATTILSGTLQVGSAAVPGSINSTSNVVLTRGGTNTGIKFFSNTDFTFDKVISDTGASGTFGTVAKDGAGKLTFNVNHTYTGNTIIDGGILEVVDNGSLGTTSSVSVAGGANLVFNRSVDMTFSASISGAGGVIKDGTARVNLGAGTTHTLLVNGSIATHATNAVTVASGAALGGTGTINRPISLSTGAALVPGSATTAGTLTTSAFTAAGSATLNFQFGAANIAIGTSDALNDLAKVNGDLTLNSANVVNVSQSPGGTLGAGTYTLFTYTGSFLGALPTLAALPLGLAGVLEHDTTARAIVLKVSAPRLRWAPSSGDCLSNLGGSGTWTGAPADLHWCNSANQKVAWSAGAIAEFTGSGGTVTVSASQSIGGLDFQTAGVILSGNPLTGTTGTETVLNAATGVTDAVISNVLAGALPYSKTGSGTVVLTGVSTYNAETRIRGGTLQVANVGTPMAINSTSNVIVDVGATLAFNPPGTTSYYFGKVISGAGNVTKRSSGRVSLTNTSTYTGQTTVAGGVFELDGGSINNTSGVTLESGGRLIFSGSGDASFSRPVTEVLGAAGQLEKFNTGTLTLTGT